MSLMAKITLGASCVFSVGTIYYVHDKQQKDRASLREGVTKDLQRQNMKIIANIKEQQDQIELTKVLVARRDAEMKADRGKLDNSG